MTFTLKKTKLFKALISVLCALAVAFAVVLLLPRGGASADEAEPTETVEYTVAWQYKADSIATEWQPLVNGLTPFTYADGADYSPLVRAVITQGETTTEVYNSGNASNTAGMSLKFAIRVGDELKAEEKLQNAAEYTVTIDGAPAYVADNDKTITFKIAPQTFALNENSFIEYSGTDTHDRLWVLKDGEATAALSDTVTYYDPDGEYDGEYGATVSEGVFYNAYVRYTGKPYTIALNEDYEVDGVALSTYMTAVKSVEYTPAQAQTGDANKVNEITTTAVITLTDNWVLDDGERTITLIKKWYIVTIPNVLRTLDGELETEVGGWAFGDTIPTLSIRPEHGDNAVFTLSQVVSDGNAVNKTVVGRFAIRYVGSSVGYYDVTADGDNYVIDTTKPLDNDYFAEQYASLEMGAYELAVYVPAYVATADHTHWWDDAAPEAAGIVYCAVSRAYSFSVTPYEITMDSVAVDDDSKDIVIKFKSDSVVYNGMENNVPEAVVTFRGMELEYDVDYTLTSHNVKVGKATFMFVGKGSFSGSVPFDGIYEYTITQAVNSWQDVPSIMYWTFGNYDKQMNLISGRPVYLDNPNDISFKVTTDIAGETPAADALASFLLTDGIVSDDVAAALNALPVGTYYLFASVKASTNYKQLVQRGVAFKVFPTTNNWEIMPSIVVWTEGQYKSVNIPTAKALYGNAHIVIKDEAGKDVYNTATGVNRLSTAKAGSYTLTATVMGTNDYNGLTYSTMFVVHEKAGIPVWVTVLIVLGALLVVALVILILIKVGVIRLLTDKMMVNIRTQASVDATVAAIRANQKNEEAKQIVAEVKQQEAAEAKKEERKKARRLKAAERKALPVEQKIAALEEKARKAEARAEKMRERAEAIQQLADKMKETTAPEANAEPTAEQPTVEPKTEPTEKPAEQPTRA
ncbi:MAG: hypothetical protein K2F90_05505 [Clostridiales bacterium]|nr:hypothetical protein [Clostridiales bacterium]